MNVWHRSFLQTNVTNKRYQREQNANTLADIHPNLSRILSLVFLAIVCIWIFQIPVDASILT